MKLIFVSSRRNREISVPSELVMDLQATGAILQVQIGPVPLRPDLARPAPRPERSESTNPRPEAETSNIRLMWQMEVPGQILVAVASQRLM